MGVVRILPGMPVEWHTLEDGVVIFERDEDGTLCSDRCIKWEGPVLELGR